MGITFPSNTRSIINEIRNVIGRAVTIFVTVSGTACTTCTLDPVTNLSTDPFCPDCGGRYWINTTSGWSVSGHVRWRRVDEPLITMGGVIEEGDCTVTIEHTSVALSNVQNADYFVVDDISLYMKNYKLRGVPSVNRITITLKEDPAT